MWADIPYKDIIIGAIYCSCNWLLLKYLYRIGELAFLLSQTIAIYTFKVELGLIKIVLESEKQVEAKEKLNIRVECD